MNGMRYGFAAWCRGSLLAVVCLGGCAMAEDGPRRDHGSDWQGSLGGGALVLPDYSGSDSYRALPVPFFDLRYGDLLFLNPFRGLGWNAVRTEAFTAGPVVSYVGGRRGRGALSDLRSVRGGAAGGVFVSWTWQSLALEGEALTPWTGDLRGARVTLGMRYTAAVSRRLIVGVGPDLVWITAGWANALYGLSDEDAVLAGLQPHRAGTGLSEFRATGRLMYLFAPRWSATVIASVGRLTDDAAASPIVRDAGSRTQYFGATAVAYSF